MSSALLLLLSDGRLPSGAHAHSGGLEEAVAGGAVADARSLERWLEGRLHTTGRMDAAFARSAAGGRWSWADLDAELAARVPSAALRRASRAQGRGLLRTARRAWPHPALDALAAATAASALASAGTGGGPMAAVALGAAALAAGLAPPDAALAAAAASVQGPAWSATRLTGMDPLEVAAVLGRVAPAIDEVARAAPGGAPATLPGPGAPLIDIGAERHATWEVRLFAS